MSYSTNASRYVENDVLTRSQEWLVPLTYEALLTSLRRALVFIEQGNIEGKAESLCRAGAMVSELNTALDRETGGEMAAGLASLYGYFALEILNIGRTLDTTLLTRLIELIEELHGAWVQAAEQVAPRAGRLVSAA